MVPFHVGGSPWKLGSSIFLAAASIGVLLLLSALHGALLSLRVQEVIECYGKGFWLVYFCRVVSSVGWRSCQFNRSFLLALVFLFLFTSLHALLGGHWMDG